MFRNLPKEGTSVCNGVKENLYINRLKYVIGPQKLSGIGEPCSCLVFLNFVGPHLFPRNSVGFSDLRVMCSTCTALAEAAFLSYVEIIAFECKQKCNI